MAEQQAATRKWPWIFSALEVGDSLALGANIRLELAPKVTVLVGRNGAGKSALLEKIQAGAHGATGVVDEEQIDPGYFACELRHEDSNLAVARYECRWHVASSEVAMSAASLGEEARSEEARFAEVEESCYLIAAGRKELVWELKDGLLRRNDGTEDRLPPERSLLNWLMSRRKSFVFNKLVDPLFEMLWAPAMPIVQAGVPRAGMSREVAIIPYPWPHFGSAKLLRRYSYVPNGIRRLTLQLAEWSQKERERLEEFEALGRRLRLFDKLAVSLFANPEHTADPKAPSQLASVAVDGVNLGLLSDGTLRVMEILASLIAPGVSLLLIEEPEIAVHPGLLARLLQEIDAYSIDREVIISTQSPQVVSWARPESLRLVERSEGKTRVRSLSAAESARIGRYLSDEGTLGDYIYSGGIDSDG